MMLSIIISIIAVVGGVALYIQARPQDTTAKLIICENLYHFHRPPKLGINKENKT